MKDHVTGLLLKHRRGATECAHAALAAASVILAFLVRFEFSLASQYGPVLLLALPVLAFVKAVVFRAFALRDLAWRHVSFEDLLRISAANAVATLGTAGALRWLIGPAFPRSIFVIDLLLCTVLMTAARAGARVLCERDRGERGRTGAAPATEKRILLYGAGGAGIRVLAELRAHSALGMTPVGFIDDDPYKRDLRLSGLRVLGTGLELNGLVQRHRAVEVLVAIPAATGPQMARILERCHAAGVTTRKIPPLSEWIHARVVDQIREVRLEDLLGRAPVQIQERDTRPALSGKVVLVTGAGGSIGSELCRQIAGCKPSVLVGLDNAETALFHIDQQMKECFPEVQFVPELGNIQDSSRLCEIFARHEPFAVYHAAAYKHVPMMEHHPFEAVENNVFGTANVARASTDCGAQIFVLVSSDKAVRPANIMGATKRMAELVCLGGSDDGTRGRAGREGPTRFLAVRFGNVLGSNGSVVPVFQRQIAAGGPVTVTHPEMRRFFMTVPEAAQLVLQASAMGVGGEIFVLEMGEQIRIVDLARNLILLSGLRPDQIRIEFTGIRPGEKLLEELGTRDEGTLPTPHGKIHVCTGARISRAALDHALRQLRHAVDMRDHAAILGCLREAIPDYHPSGLLLRRASGGRPIRAVAAAG